MGGDVEDVAGVAGAVDVGVDVVGVMSSRKSHPSLSHS